MDKTSLLSFSSAAGEWSASVIKERLLKIAEKPIFSCIEDIDSYLTKKLANSSQTQRLKELARSSGKVLIICDDCTRPTPTSKILPVISDLLVRSGVEPDRQTVIFATGSHRNINEIEAFGKIGSRLWNNIHWLSHDWNIKLARVGYTKSGIPIDINPILLEYNCIIGIGSVFPHRYCGWSGGGKIIVPGVSGAETLSQTHWMPYYDNSVYLGSTKNRAIREIMGAAEDAGLSFLVQCICDGDGRINDIIIGKPKNAHKEAISKAASVMAVKVPIADIVITEAWPEGTDLWQAGKSLYAAENVVSPGGHIILVASLDEGIGPHKLYARLMSADEDDILKYKDEHNSQGLAAAAAYATSLVRKKASISIVTNSDHSAEIAKCTGLNLYKNLQDAINSIPKDDPTITFSVLHEAPLMLPMPEEADV